MPFKQERLIDLVNAAMLLRKELIRTLDGGRQLYMDLGASFNEDPTLTAAGWDGLFGAVPKELMLAMEVVGREEAHVRATRGRNINNARRMEARRKGIPKEHRETRRAAAKATRAAQAGWTAEELAQQRAIAQQESPPGRDAAAAATFHTALAGGGEIEIPREGTVQVPREDEDLL